MTALPAMPPVTIPVPVPMVATFVLLLLHEPPAAPSLNVIFKPEHTVEAPAITPGDAIVVTDAVAAVPQPVE
jgi:hypothetical protein